MELNNFNAKKFTRSNLLPKKDGSKPTNKQAEQEFEQNMELLDRCKRYYESLEYLRTENERNDRYLNGDQLSDTITDPDTGKQITEEAYIKKQGKNPIVINMLVKILTPILGIFSSKHLEPFVLMRDESKKRVGRVLTALMKTAYERLFIRNLDVEGLKEVIAHALVAFRTYYKYDSFRQTADVKIEVCETNRLFFDDNTTGLYGENLRTIGYLHDWALGDVLKNFAHSKDEGDRIIQLYKDCGSQYAAYSQQFDPKEKKRTLSFYGDYKPDKCRVIEVWTKEGMYTCRCHDIKTGDDYFIDIEDKPLVEEENARRIAEYGAKGIAAEEVPIIDTSFPYGDSYDEIWVVRYLTPNGYVLKKEVSPYEHGEHPFTIGIRTMTAGTITSLISTSIASQRMINALVQRIEYMRMAAAKGTLIVDQDQIDASRISLEEFGRQYSKAGSVIALKRGEQYKDPQLLTSENASASDMSMLQTHISMLADITGIHGPVRGEEAKSGTPSSLYMQETQNAQNNITELLEWYQGLLLFRNIKALKVMLQYYDDGRKVRIVGEDGGYTEEEYNHADIANLEYDVYMTESQDEGPLYIQNEDKLFNLLSGGLISIKSYLRNSAAPYAEKLLETIEAEEEATQKQQAEMQQQAAQAQQAQVEQQAQQPQQ